MKISHQQLLNVVLSGISKLLFKIFEARTWLAIAFQNLTRKLE